MVKDASHKHRKRLKNRYLYDIGLLIALLCFPQSNLFAENKGIIDHRIPLQLSQHLGDYLVDIADKINPTPTPNTKAGLSIEDIFDKTQYGPFDDAILASAKRWKLDPFLLKGLLANESKLDPIGQGKYRFANMNGIRVIVSGGAIGIAQFTGGGVRGVNFLRLKRRKRSGAHIHDFDMEQALNPVKAIDAAAELLSHLIQRFGRDGGVTAYNSGIASGKAVSRYGFWNARKSGKLNRIGIYEIQGYRFLLNVLRHTNWYRTQSGLPPLADPDADRNEG